MLHSLYAAGAGDFEKADQQLEKCFKMAPEEPIVYLIRAGVKHHQKDTIGFFQDINLALEKGFNSNTDLFSEVPYYLYKDDPRFQEAVKKYNIPIYK